MPSVAQPAADVFFLFAFTKVSNHFSIYMCPLDLYIYLYIRFLVLSFYFVCNERETTFPTFSLPLRLVLSSRRH